MEFLEGSLQKLMSNILKVGALRRIQDLKEEYIFSDKFKFLHRCISKILFKDCFLKCGYCQRYFSRILLIHSEINTSKNDFFEGIFQEFCL